MPDLSYTTLTFRGLSFGRGTVRKLRRGTGLSGWEELPPADLIKSPRFGLHGAVPAAVRFDGRTITMAGYVEAADDRDALVAELRAALTPPQDPTATETLTVSVAGATLTADVQLLAGGVAIGDLWGSGWFDFKAQWWAPDHRRFGPRQTQTASFEGATTGITPPLTPPLVFPANPTSGQVTVFNPGTAPAPVQFQLGGQIIGQPGVQASTGKYVRFAANIDPGVVLAFDTGGGSTLDGQFLTPTGGSALMVEMEAPPGTTTYQAIGDPQGVGPWLTVSSLPAYW